MQIWKVSFPPSARGLHLSARLGLALLLRAGLRSAGLLLRLAGLLLQLRLGLLLRLL